MKLAINVLNGYPISVEESIIAIARVGFDGFFSTWQKGCPVGHWAAVARENGLAFQSIHAPIQGSAEIWEPNGEVVLDTLLSCLDDCRKYQVPIMIVHVFQGFDVEESPNDLGLKRFEQLLKEAERVHVKIAFENTEGEKYLEAVMRCLGQYSSLGFCWDSGHESCYNRGRDMLALYGDKLVATHINDNLGVTGEKICWEDDAHLLPFDGVIDWNNAAQRLKKCPSTNFLTLELKCKNNLNLKYQLDHYQKMSYDSYLVQAYERAKRLEALLSR